MGKGIGGRDWACCLHVFHLNFVIDPLPSQANEAKKKRSAIFSTCVEGS